MFPQIVLLVALSALGHAKSTCPAVETCLSNLEAGKECQLLPIPGRSPSVTLGPLGFNLTELRTGNRRLAVVDFPRSTASITPDGTYLLTTATLQVLQGEEPRRVDMIYGHRHTDHIGFAGMYKDFVESNFPDAKIFTWATRETNDFVGRIPNNDVPLANVIVGRKGRTVNIAEGLDLKLLVLGGHTNADLVAHVIPSSTEPGVAHFVDMVWPGGAPFINFALTVDLGRYITAQEELLRLDFELFSAGHGPLASKQDIRTNIEYTKFAIQAAIDAVREADPRRIQNVLDRVADPADVAFGNSQWSFIEIFNIQAELCERKVIERWGCELYGTGSVAKGHCFSALFYNFIDQ